MNATATPPHYVVLGGGIAGPLAAAALAPRAGHVTLVERDRLPVAPSPRAGAPQGRHFHALLSTGARAMEALLPGTLDALWRAGARRADLPGDSLVYGPDGWARPFPGRAYIVICSRPLLEQVIRVQLMRQHHVELVEGCTVTGLTGTKRRVTGVPARRRDADGDIVIDADLVVDATGRSAKTPRWLQELGLPPTTATTIDAGIGYASRVVAVAHPEDWLSPFVTGLASACRQ